MLGMKICPNGPGHMTTMASRPIYKTTKRPTTFKLGTQHRIFKYFKICSNDDPGLTLAIIMT